MGISKNHFKKEFAKAKIEIKVLGCKIEVNTERFGEKLDAAQDILDEQVWQDVQTYMPINTGNLIRQTNAKNQTVRGEVYLYPPDSDYGHYQYEGIKYIDPQYGIGAFYSPSYGYWSRKGVPKIKSEETLTYGRDEAVAHWGKEAEKNYKEQWVEVVKRAMK